MFDNLFTTAALWVATAVVWYDSPKVACVFLVIAAAYATRAAWRWL
jgi:hypothetical protein